MALCARMEFGDLNDDVLRLIIDHLETSAEVLRLSCTSRRMADLARVSLLQHKHGIFRIGRDAPRASTSLPQNLLQLVANPDLTGYVRCIATSVSGGGGFYLLPEPYRRSICDQIYDLQLYSKRITRETRTILHVIEQDVVHLVDLVNWLRLCMNAVYAALWMCPNIEELRLDGAWPLSVAEQMHDIGRQICSQHDACLCTGTPEPYERLCRVVKITRLRLSSLALCVMHENPDAFNLLMLKSLQEVKFKKLDTSQFPYSHFWPADHYGLCNARKMVVDLGNDLPSPLIVADLLSRCPSLRIFDLRGRQSDDSHESVESYIERVDAMANEKLCQISRSDVKGLPGYADLIRCSLETSFERLGWNLGCFLPCDRIKHRRWRLQCVCVAVCIEQGNKT